MLKSEKLTRRRALRTVAAATALPLVHIRTAGAAGKLAVGLWDHWVPGGTEKMREQVKLWANKNKVDVTLDFITSQGNKLLLTAAAEAQAKTGHDIMTFFQYDVINYEDSLEPVDDVIGNLVKKYGKYDPAIEYLAKRKGKWLAIPGTDPTAALACCARISMFKKFAGIDLPAMYPAEPHATPEAANWNFETFLKVAEACAKAGFPFGMGLGSTGDSVNNTGSIFASFGAELVNAKGEITVESDNVMKVLEYGQKLVKFFPADTVSYDDASNNRALISGKSALIYNPPSAWAVAKRDAPDVAKDCWTFPCPVGPAGRYIPYVYAFPSPPPKNCWNTCRNANRSRNAPSCPKASTCRPNSACRTSRYGKRSIRRRAPCTTIRPAPGITRGPVWPGTRHRRNSRSRFSIARPSRPCGRNSTAANRSSKSSPGPRTRLAGSCADPGADQLRPWGRRAR